MAPVTRRTVFSKVLIERDSESEQSSSEEEDDDGVTTASERTENLGVGSDANREGKAPITISLKKVCKITFFFSFNFFVCHKVLFFLSLY